MADILDRLVRRRRAPERLFAGNGSEFNGHMVVLWGYHHKVRIDFSRSGRPTDSAFIEAFIGSLRDECLNLHWFETLAEAKTQIEAWRRDDNEGRPHAAFGYSTLTEYATGTVTSKSQDGHIRAGGQRSIRTTRAKRFRPGMYKHSNRITPSGHAKASTNAFTRN